MNTMCLSGTGVLKVGYPHACKEYLSVHSLHPIWTSNLKVFTGNKRALLSDQSSYAVVFLWGHCGGISSFPPCMTDPCIPVPAVLAPCITGPAAGLAPCTAVSTPCIAGLAPCNAGPASHGCRTFL